MLHCAVRGIDPVCEWCAAGQTNRCERIAFLSRGHLIALGTADQITAQFAQPSIEDVFIELQRRDEEAMR